MKSRKTAIALALSAISLLSGCGSSGNSNPAVAGPNIIGCAQYNSTGTCISPIYGSTGGCVPITQPIYFGGSGNFIGSILAAGNIPNYGNYGSLAVSASPISSSGGSAWTSPSGLTVNIGNNYSGAQTSLYGSLTLSQAAQYNIQMTSQGSAQYPSYSGAWGTSFYGQSYGSSSACVSGIALQLAPTYTSVQGVTGYAYLYLNNTQHGYILPLY